MTTCLRLTQEQEEKIFLRKFFTKALRGEIAGENLQIIAEQADARLNPRSQPLDRLNDEQRKDLRTLFRQAIAGQHGSGLERVATEVAKDLLEELKKITQPTQATEPQ